MSNILFVISTMGGGGAERVMSNVINYLSHFPEYKITLLLLKEEGNTYLNSIPENVNIINLKIKGRIRYALLKIIKAILKIHPNLCFIGLDKLNIFLAPFLFLLKAKGIKCIARETNVPSCQYPNNPLLKIVYILFYNQYDKVIAQSNDMRDDLIKNWGINPSRIIKINNPVDIEKIERNVSINQTLPNSDGVPKKYVMVGRLSLQKGYDILFKRISRLKTPHDFTISVFGKGELKEELKCTIQQLGLEDIIVLEGYTNNPYQQISESDGLILSSRYEGFPNVLLEANALGKPIFVNNCPGGINEIVKNGINGIIADFNKQDSFENGLESFLSTKFNSTDIKELNKSRYSFEAIMPQYKKTIDSLIRS